MTKPLHFKDLVMRVKKAERFFDNPSIPNQVKERWIPEYQALVRSYNELMYIKNTFEGEFVDP